MTFRRTTALASFAASALLSLGVAGTAGAAAPAHAAPAPTTSSTGAVHHVEFFQLGYRPGIVKPKTIFLSADSGPYLKKLHWDGWGHQRATAHGRLDNSCASCGGQKQAPAVVHLSKPVKCRGTKAYAYTAGYAVSRDHDGTRHRITVTTGCPSPR